LFSFVLTPLALKSTASCQNCQSKETFDETLNLHIVYKTWKFYSNKYQNKENVKKPAK